VSRWYKVDLDSVLKVLIRMDLGRAADVPKVSVSFLRRNCVPMKRL
jgi:hypothetical protein